MTRRNAPEAHLDRANAREEMKRYLDLALREMGLAIRV